MTGCVAPREPRPAGAKQGGPVAVESPPAVLRSETAAPKPESGGEKGPVSGSTGGSVAATEAPLAHVERVPMQETPPPAVKIDVPAPKVEPSAAKIESPAPKTDGPATKVPAKAAAPPPPAEKPPMKESVAAAPVKSPTLDLALLEKRLKETSAIGVFTKLTLKNQVDDLLNRFRAHYEGRAKTTLADLRQPYDLLILKVLALLQDGDPSLARAITDSREAIWSILADPARFKTL